MINQGMYGQYQPLYDQLLEQCPDICREGELFQFSLPAFMVSWDEADNDGLYSAIDILPADDGGIYIPSGSRLTTTFENFIDSLSEEGISFEELEMVRRYLKEERITIERKGMGLSVPEISIEKSDYICKENSLCFQFSSEMWDEKEEPVTLKGGIGISEWLSKKKYTFSITIEGLRCCIIKRGKWYDEKLLQPSAVWIEGSMLKKEAYLGKSGYFSLIPQKVLFIDRMRMRLNLETSYVKKGRSALSNPLLNGIAGGNYYFLGIPVELEISMGGLPGRMINVVQGIQNCFGDGLNTASVFGITSKRLI